MKPGRPKGPATKTPALLDKLHQYITEQFQPPFYETPNTRQIGAAMGMSHTQAARYLEYLEKDGRLLRSPSGKLVPSINPTLVPLLMQEVEWRKKMSDPELQAAHQRYHESLKQAEEHFSKTAHQWIEHIEDGTGREWLHFQDDGETMHFIGKVPSPYQTPLETPVDQPDSNPPD